MGLDSDSEKSQAVVRITRDFMRRGASSSGGWNRAQLHELGVDWPLQKGWLETILGSLVTVESADKFLEAKNPKKIKSGLRYPKSNRESPQELARLLCSRMRRVDTRNEVSDVLWNKFYQEINFYLDNFLKGAAQ